MTQQRPPVPAALARAVKEEAGFACAIPTCRMTPVEIAHIESWSTVRQHTFDNLIALCPNHHTRYDVEKRIPRASMLNYKTNLALLNGRYSTLERRLIEQAVDWPPNTEIPIHIGVRILISRFLDDGLLAEADDLQYQITGFEGGIKTTELYRFTEKGREFVRRWKDAEPLTD
ncbi:HNH endonuclease [Streptomyces sp. NPDC058678]|uniref:HNH endonuclease n=1 Tax=Streptomyces sp. NPDC058678 TaxID=3346595 RepID=UPI00365C77B6